MHRRGFLASPPWTSGAQGLRLPRPSSLETHGCSCGKEVCHLFWRKDGFAKEPKFAIPASPSSAFAVYFEAHKEGTFLLFGFFVAFVFGGFDFFFLGVGSYNATTIQVALEVPVTWLPAPLEKVCTLERGAVFSLDFLPPSSVRWFSTLRSDALEASGRISPPPPKEAKV